MSDDKDFGKKCPKCGTEWTKTPRVVRAGFWVHCKPCNKKAEDLIEEHRKDVNPHKDNRTPMPDYMFPDIYDPVYGTAASKPSDKDFDDALKELEDLFEDDDDWFL